MIDSINPSEEERTALQAMIKAHGGSVVVADASPSKLLSQFWQEFGLAALIAVTNDPDLAKEVFDSSDISKTSPSQVLKEASSRSKNAAILSQLPKYRHLPSIPQFADNLAKTYKTEGLKGAMKLIEKSRVAETKIKSIGFAFLLATNQAQGKEWHFSKTEMEFAEFLRDFVSKLLEAKPNQYDEALRLLCTAAGCTDKIEKA